MIYSRRTLAFALAALAAPSLSFAAPVQDATSLFNEAKTLLAQGDNDAALAKLKQVLAADPSQEEAYQLWVDTDTQVWLDLMVQGGEYQAIAKRLQQRATFARQARRNDQDAVNALCDTIKNSGNAVERRQAIDTLAGNHGPFAVSRLARALRGDQANDDWRIRAMHTLQEMEVDVVPPLLEALSTDDAVQRRYLCMTLMNIGDSRAAATLEALAATDSDGSVVQAAKRAAAACGSEGDAVARFLKDGDDYHFRRISVLRAFDYSSVIWTWEGGDLQFHNVPRAIYNNEMAKKSYYSAMSLSPASLDAAAGIARESTDIQAKLALLAGTGVDVGDLADKAAIGELAVAAAGVAALDHALIWSVRQDDNATGARLCAALARQAHAPTPGLEAALDASDPSMRGEAALALAHIAHHSGVAAAPNVVAALTEAAGREVVRIAAVIDGDADRSSTLMGSLDAKGVLANHRGSGAQGLAMLMRIPGVDVILVGDRTGGNTTTDAVLTTLAETAGLNTIPVYLVTSDGELGEAYSDRVAGIVSNAGDVSTLDAVFSESLTGDRAIADALASRCADALATLGAAGHTDVTSAASALASTLAFRNDGVTIPAMSALEIIGSTDQVGSLMTVLVNGERSDEARMGAADAIGAIASRSGAIAGLGADLATVVESDSALGVRVAAARALGRTTMDAAERAALLQRVRIHVSE
jgi:tetratricopeptide (TPR) repeat protein